MISKRMRKICLRIVHGKTLSEWEWIKVNYEIGKMLHALNPSVVTEFQPTKEEWADILSDLRKSHASYEARRKAVTTSEP